MYKTIEKIALQHGE